MTRRHGMQERLWDLAEEYLREHPEVTTHTADELVEAFSSTSYEQTIVKDFKFWMRYERGLK